MPKKPVNKPMSLAEQIDELGRLKAQAAEIEAKTEKIKEGIKKILSDKNLEKAEGSLFKVSISRYQSTKIDWNKIQEDYDLPVEKYQVTSQITRMDLKAR